MSPTETAFGALGVPEPIAAVLEQRGYDQPTPVQRALLEPTLGTKDLLVSSQTGSGKTVAFGLLIARVLPTTRSPKPAAHPPVALVITPTRELANQVRDELAWLLVPTGARVVALTGGTSIVGELRALAAGADVIVGTPGRLNDHLKRGSLLRDAIGTVVLDEADEMLDMGFREEIEAILGVMPTGRRTLLLSATIPPAIRQLAKKFQREPVQLDVDPQGASNENISHVAHIVPPAHRADAIINLLLMAPDERTLVFARTRADASNLAQLLSSSGFRAAALTGEMAQRERTATMEAFRSGGVTILVATDVAARGIDVSDITRVLHVDLPGDAETLTHRAGRTGRAGRSGVSVLIVPPFARGRAGEMLRAAGAQARWCPPPDAAEILASAEARLRARLSARIDEAASATSDGANGETGTTARPPSPDETRRAGFARALLESTEPLALVTALLAEVKWDGPCPPRTIQQPPRREKPSRFDAQSRDGRPAPRFDTRPREQGPPPRVDAPRRDARPLPPFAQGPDRREGWAAFRVTFGRSAGATPARLVAMLCRRGGVQGRDIGAIEIGEDDARFEVASNVADQFDVAASRRDAREPAVRITRLGAPRFHNARPQPPGTSARVKPKRHKS